MDTFVDERSGHADGRRETMQGAGELSAKIAEPNSGFGAYLPLFIVCPLVLYAAALACVFCVHSRNNASASRATIVVLVGLFGGVFVGVIYATFFTITWSTLLRRETWRPAEYTTVGSAPTTSRAVAS